MNKSKKVILFLMDSISSAKFNEFLDDGIAKNLKSFIDSNSLKIDKCIISLPTASITTHVSLLTGVYPYLHGVPGLRWYDKINKKLRTYVGVGYRKINSDLNQNIKTLFERCEVSSACLNEPFNRGAGFKKILIPFITGSRKTFKNLLKLIESDKYQLIMVWFHKTDEIAHRFGPDSNKFAEEFKKVDYYFGKLIACLKNREELQNYLIVVTADHGAINVNQHFDIYKHLRSLGLPIKGRFYHRHVPIRSKDFVLTVQGDRCAQIYLPSNNSLSVKDELVNNITKSLIRHEAVDIIASRSRSGEVKLSSRRGNAVIHIDGQNSSDLHAWSYSYRTNHDSDPLGYWNHSQSAGLVNTGFFSDREWLKATFDCDYPNFIPQVSLLLHTKRAGDIIVFANKDWDLKGWRIGWNWGRHKGSHGGALKDEICTPLLIGNLNIKTSELDFCESTDIVPTILRFLNLDIDNQNLNGIDLLNY